ncbi:MAG: xanthine dehydrogenase family protein subunit M [Desulfobacteraceae bacterium]|nr:xanthine dehydrogenase family protein subunit M [Desulfobacteraceae bacterium]
MTTRFFKPGSISDAMDAYLKSDGTTHYFAGGTDLMVKLGPPGNTGHGFISLERLSGLNRVQERPEDKIFIGAMTGLSEVAGSGLIAEHFPALAAAAGSVGSPSIRNMGTIGGNVCNASPSADTAPPLMVYGASAVVAGRDGEKTIPMDAFFTGPSTTCLKPGDILTGFMLPKNPAIRAGFVKLGKRKAMECSIVSLGLSLEMDGAGKCGTVRIALGAVAPTPVRIVRAEKILEGRPLEAEFIHRAAAAVAGDIHPIDDLRATAGYRRKMAGRMVRETLLQMCRQDHQ